MNTTSTKAPEQTTKEVTDIKDETNNDDDDDYDLDVNFDDDDYTFNLDMTNPVASSPARNVAASGLTTRAPSSKPITHTEPKPVPVQHVDEEEIPEDVDMDLSFGELDSELAEGLPSAEIKSSIATTMPTLSTTEADATDDGRNQPLSSSSQQARPVLDESIISNDISILRTPQKLGDALTASSPAAAAARASPAASSTSTTRAATVIASATPSSSRLPPITSSVPLGSASLSSTNIITPSKSSPRKSVSDSSSSLNSTSPNGSSSPKSSRRSSKGPESIFVTKTEPLSTSTQPSSPATMNASVESSESAFVTGNQNPSDGQRNKAPAPSETMEKTLFASSIVKQDRVPDAKSDAIVAHAETSDSVEYMDRAQGIRIPGFGGATADEVEEQEPDAVEEQKRATVSSSSSSADISTSTVDAADSSHTRISGSVVSAVEREKDTDPTTSDSSSSSSSSSSQDYMDRAQGIDLRSYITREPLSTPAGSSSPARLPASPAAPFSTPAVSSATSATSTSSTTVSLTKLDTDHSLVVIAPPAVLMLGDSPVPSAATATGADTDDVDTDSLSSNAKAVNALKRSPIFVEAVLIVKDVINNAIHMELAKLSGVQRSSSNASTSSSRQALAEEVPSFPRNPRLWQGAIGEEDMPNNGEGQSAMAGRDASHVVNGEAPSSSTSTSTTASAYWSHQLMGVAANVVSQSGLSLTLDVSVVLATLLDEAGALLSAARLGLVNMVDSLIDLGANVDGEALGPADSDLKATMRRSYRGRERCETRETPLYRAAFNGHAEVVSLLLNHNARYDTSDAFQWTALHNAAFRGHESVVRVLIKHDMAYQQTQPQPHPQAEAQPTGFIQRQNSGRRTALCLAAGQGHLDIVEEIVHACQGISKQELAIVMKTGTNAVYDWLDEYVKRSGRDKTNV